MDADLKISMLMGKKCPADFIEKSKILFEIFDCKGNIAGQSFMHSLTISEKMSEL